MTRLTNRTIYNVLVATPPCVHGGIRGHTRVIATRLRLPIPFALRALRELQDSGLVRAAPKADSPSGYHWFRTSDAEHLLHPPGLEAIRGS